MFYALVIHLFHRLTLVDNRNSNSSGTTGETALQTASLLRCLFRGAPPGIFPSRNAPLKTLVDLPTELLTQILFNAPSESFSVSRVCKRLRRVVTDIPQLWTHVSNNLTPMELELSIARSGKEKLYLLLFANRGDNLKCTPFLPLLLPHGKRWKEFRFEANEFRTEFFTELSEIYEVMKGRVLFPALETLHLQCYHPDYINNSGNVYRRYSNWPRTTFFWGRWELPNLRRFYISSVLADIKSQCPALRGEELTSLQIDYHRDRTTYEDFEECMQFVGGLPQLRDLKITFHKLKSGGHDLVEQIKLPNLEFLCLRFTPNAFRSRRRNTLSVLDELMSNIIAPRLSQMALQFEASRKLDVMAYLQRIPYNTLLTLRRLYVQFREPAFNALIVVPHRVAGLFADPNHAFLDELEEKISLDLPKVELADLPKTYRANLGEHLCDDENAREFLKDFRWFNGDSTDEESTDSNSGDELY